MVRSFQSDLAGLASEAAAFPPLSFDPSWRRRIKKEKAGTSKKNPHRLAWD
jgi:hypothetical protein